MTAFTKEFFKDDFCSNKNRFKNDALNTSEEKSDIVFKVNKVEKIKKERGESFKEKTLKRINVLKEFFSEFAAKIFDENVV